MKIHYEQIYKIKHINKYLGEVIHFNRSETENSEAGNSPTTQKLGTLHRLETHIKINPFLRQQN